MSLKVVFSIVYGIIATLKLSFLELTTVRLTPFIVIDPFSIVILLLPKSYLKVKI